MLSTDLGWIPGVLGTIHPRLTLELNASFNVNEPVVCKPALACFLRTKDCAWEFSDFKKGLTFSTFFSLPRDNTANFIDPTLRPGKIAIYT